MTKKAVFFDYDGVLGRTMEDNFRAWKNVFKKYGVNIKKDDFFLNEGLNPLNMAKAICRIHNFNLPDFMELVNGKEAYYKSHNHFRLYPKVEEIIRKLSKRGIKLVVVSGAAEERLRNVTPSKFLSFFNGIITADKVKNPKPSPEPYQKALALLGLKPDEAIVVENAPLGIKSAKAAGIYCIAICSTLTREYLSEADKIIDRFSDLENVLFKR